MSEKKATELVGNLEKGAWVQFKPDGIMYQITEIGKTRATLVDGEGNKTTIPLRQAVYPLEANPRAAKPEDELLEGVKPLGAGDIASGWQKTRHGRMIYRGDLLLENAKEEFVYEKITNAPSYPKLLASYKGHLRSLYSADDPFMVERMQEVELQPWELLTAHAGVMQAKSARAITLRNLADSVFKETELPRLPEGKFRGESGLDWDNLEVPAVKPTAMSPVDYDRRYSLEELREMARQAGLSASGSKKEIAARLIAENGD